MKKNTSILWQTCAAFAAVALLAVGCSEEEPGSELMAPYCQVNANEVTVTRTTATLTGLIEAANPASIKEYGFRYSTSSTLNKDDKTTVTVKLGESLEGSGSVQTLIKDLSPNTTYYYCLYTSTGVSESVSKGENYFRTAETSSPIFTELVKDSIGENFARIKCSVEEIGDTYLMEYGVAYKKLKDKTFVSIPADTLDNEATRSFTVELSELDPSTQYVIRAYAKNSSDKDANTGVREGYSVNDTITTENLLAAEIEGYEPSEVLSTSAKISGQVLGAAGSGGKVEEIGVCYSETNEYPVWTDSKVVIEGTDLKKVYTATLTGLKEYTQYYARMYAKNIVDGKERYGYGEVQMFTTTGLKKPELKYGEESIMSSTPTSLTVAAVITNYDEAALIEKGFLWSLTTGEITLEEAEAANTKLVVTDGGKSFSATITGLEIDKGYYVRPYAVYQSPENQQVGYPGWTRSFWTQSFRAPDLDRPMVEDVTATTAKLTGRISVAGNTAIVKCGFFLKATGTWNDFSLEDSDLQVEADENFTATITGLNPNVAYKVRSYAVCRLGDREETVSGRMDSFDTKQMEGIAFSDVRTSNTIYSISISARLGVTAGEVQEKGFCWNLDDDGAPILENCLGSQQGVDNADGTYALTISDLLPLTQYRIRSYAKVKVGDQLMTFYSGGNSSVRTAEFNNSTSQIMWTEGDTYFTTTFEMPSEATGIEEYGLYWKSETENDDAARQVKATNVGNQYTISLTGLTPGTRYNLKEYVVVGGQTYTWSSFTQTIRARRVPTQEDNQSPDIKN